MPRFDDGAIDMQELLRRLAEQVVNAVMDAEADQLCGGGANSRNGYRERGLATCVSTLTLRIPKLRTGNFFPDDMIERYQRVDRALVAAEMHATGTRKVQRVAEKMGVSRLSKDRWAPSRRARTPTSRNSAQGRSTAPRCPTSGSTRPTSSAATSPRRLRRGGWRRVLGVGVVDTES